MAWMRLQKYLADAGLCSRRRGERWIREGRVRVNGEVVRVQGRKVDPERDVVEVDGERVAPLEERIYIALHKPAGYVTSCRQPGKRIVLDLVPCRQRIYPVGRLDKDSTGLLLLTNDGRLHLRLSHPSFDHEKEYEVTTARPVSDAALRRMAAGMPILGTRTRPAEVTRLGERAFRIVLREGRNRQIRRMVKSLGNEVVSLKRIRIASIRLGDLPAGAWRPLTAEEVRSLLARAGEG
ncbi:MAG: pseudouridine synthase [Desulfobacterales bacterium]